MRKSAIAAALAALSILLISPVRSAAGEGFAFVVDRETDSGTLTFVCTANVDGEEGPCFMENKPPAVFAWDALKYDASGKYLLAQTPDTLELRRFALGGGEMKVAAAENGISDYEPGGADGAVYYAAVDENYTTRAFRAVFADDANAPTVTQCPGSGVEGLMFDSRGDRVVNFFDDEKSGRKILTAYDSACGNELARAEIPLGITTNASAAVLSPDGSRAALIGFHKQPPTAGLFLIDVASGAVTELLGDHAAALGEGQPDIFSISPDNGAVAFVYLHKDATKTLHIVTADGKTLVTASAPDADSFRSERLRWHPSGEWVSATAMHAEDDGSDVYSLALDGETHNLTGGDADFKWGQSISADGKFMLFISGSEQALNVYDVEGAELLGQLAAPGKYAFPEWIEYKK